jgi:hypothetical protein
VPALTRNRLNSLLTRLNPNTPSIPDLVYHSQPFQNFILSSPILDSVNLLAFFRDRPSPITLTLADTRFFFNYILTAARRARSTEYANSLNNFLESSESYQSAHIPTTSQTTNNQQQPQIPVTTVQALEAQHPLPNPLPFDPNRLINIEVISLTQVNTYSYFIYQANNNFNIGDYLLISDWSPEEIILTNRHSTSYFDIANTWVYIKNNGFTLRSLLYFLEFHTWPSPQQLRQHLPNFARIKQVSSLRLTPTSLNHGQ